MGEDSEIYLIDSYQESAYGLSNDTEMNPLTSTLPLKMGGRYPPKTRFSHLNDKTLLWSSSDEHFPAVKLLGYISRSQMWKFFRNRCIIDYFIVILVHPSRVLKNMFRYLKIEYLDNGNR